MNRKAARRQKWTVVVAATALLLLAYPQLQPALAAPASVITLARNLAENILGAGSVKSLRAAHGESELLIRWESPTYREANDQAYNRDLLYGEAVLTMNAILGRLPQVLRVRFVIMKGDRMLATGESWRARGGVSLAFGPELGGGAYIPAPEPQNTSSGRKPAAKQATGN